MKNIVYKYKYHIITGIIGGALGFLYWRYVGCSSGTCLITSIWYHSTIYGIIIGVLFGSIINDEIDKRKKKKETKKD